jgi:hypothetical protein
VEGSISDENVTKVEPGGQDLHFDVVWRQDGWERVVDPHQG